MSRHSKGESFRTMLRRYAGLTVTDSSITLTDGTKLGPNYLWQATAELTDAQIKALPTTVTQIVAAPANPSHVILCPTFTSGGQCILQCDSSAGAYTNINSAATLFIGYVNGLGGLSGNAFGAADLLSNLFGSGDSEVWFVDPPTTANASEGGVSTYVGRAMGVQVVNQGDGNFTGGHESNTLRLSMAYYVLDTTTGLLVPAP